MHEERTEGTVADFIRVAGLDQLRERRGVSVLVDGREIALFLLNGDVFAVRNSCAHQHFSVLHQGTIDGYRVSCPMHGWTYDVRSGKATSGEGNIPTYPVRIQGNDVYIEVPD